MGRVGKRQQHKPREQAADLSTNNSQKTERVVRRDNNNEDIVDIEVYAHSKEHNDSRKATRMTAEVCSRCLLDGDDTARAARSATTTLLALLALRLGAQLELAVACTKKLLQCVCRCCYAAVLLIGDVAEINHTQRRRCSTLARLQED